MNIIPADPADFETVKRITHETIRTVYPHYYPAGAVEFFLAHHSAEKIADDLRANCVYLCQNAQGQAVGTVTLHENEIDRLFVLPEYQGQGFGRMLLDFAEAEIAKHFDTVTLSASLPAKSIYLKRGYQAAEYCKIPTGNGDVLCFDQMEKPCSAAGTA